MGEFIKVMEEKSDEELIQILLVERNDFDQKAIIDAIEVAKARNLSIDYEEILTGYSELGLKAKDNSASKMIRFLHFIIDFTIMYFITAIIGLLIFVLTEDNEIAFPIVGIVFVAVRFLYYYTLENKYNRTLGKFITGTKVVGINGDKPNDSAILARTICRFIPFDFVSFLGEGWHDSLSETKVVKVSKIDETKILDSKMEINTEMIKESEVKKGFDDDIHKIWNEINKD
tara:strand:+ start:221 stop:910 length:690 start_codon:yes stop_codon:yes gene_type:complete